MSSPAGPSDFVMTRRLADGTVEWIPLKASQHVAAEPGEQYALIDRSNYEAPQTLVAERQGEDLVVQVKGATVLVLDGFFATEDVAFHPTPDIAGGAGPFSGASLTPDSPVLAGSPAGEQVVWSAEGAQVGEAAQQAQASSEQGGEHGSSTSPLLWGGIALGGVGLLAAAGGGGGSGGGGSDGGGGGTPLPADHTVAGTVVIGPVIAGNGLSVQVLQADGTTQLGEAKVAADGSFSVEVGDYSGVIIAQVVDSDDGEDQLDEASGANKDLNASLDAVVDLSQASSTVSLNINPLTTLAAGLASREAGGNAPTADQVTRSNSAVAELFGLSGLHSVAVTPINSGAYDAADGLSAGEKYGALLASFSGADLNNGGDGQQTIDDVLAGLTLSSNGKAELSESAQAVLMQGAQTTESATGVSLSAFVSSVVDTQPPDITSGNTATDIPENSGAGQVVYTATATDAGSVTWSLADGGDAAAFSIDDRTGAVTLNQNPDYETKSSYSFTVVATDDAGNAAKQPVSLAIGNEDDSRPSITSGAVATAVDENSGADQLVYTAAATDDGPVAWSLAAGGDAAHFSIDAKTGAVTLIDDPDYEAKSSYRFTVVATDTDDNSSSQAVSLAIDNLDEVAPSITSGATAAAIDENSGADQSRLHGHQHRRPRHQQRPYHLQPQPGGRCAPFHHRCGQRCGDPEG